MEKFFKKLEAIAAVRHNLLTIKHDGQPWAHRLKRPDTTWADLPEPFQHVTPDVAVQLETEIKYAGYLKREEVHIARNQAHEDKSIPDWFDFDLIPGLKAEARAKLKKIRPQTFAQAGRISGINPTDISLLQIHAKRGKAAAGAS